MLLYISLGSAFIFMLWKRCAYAQVEFRHNKHLARVEKGSCFDWKYLVLLPRTCLELSWKNIQWFHTTFTHFLGVLNVQVPFSYPWFCLLGCPKPPYTVAIPLWCGSGQLHPHSAAYPHVSAPLIHSFIQQNLVTLSLSSAHTHTHTRTAHFLPSIFMSTFFSPRKQKKNCSSINC